MDLKLTKKFYETKGLEDKWRYQLYEMQREQESINREVENLKLSPRNHSRKQGVIHHGETHPNSHGSDHLSHHKICPVLAAKTAEQGKDFFGYHSSPGNKNLAHKTAIELETELNEYFHKPEVHTKKRLLHFKLKEQQQENKTIQDKFQNWKSSGSSRKRFSSKEHPTQRHLETLREELLLSDPESKPTFDGKKQTRPKTVASGSNINLHPDTCRPISTTEKDGVDNFTGSLDEETLTQSIHANNHPKHNRPTTTTEVILHANASSLDSEYYAPDGKIRTALNMPDPDETFKQARNARYLRTRFKRDFERQMSNSEIFQH